MQIEKKIAESLANGHDEIASLGKAAERAANGAAREFHNILADIEDLLAEATALTGDDLSHVASKISDRLASAKSSVEEFGSSINKRALKTVAITNNYVHEQPWTAIGVGVGVGTATGLVLGYMLARRA